MEEVKNEKRSYNKILIIGIVIVIVVILLIFVIKYFDSNDSKNNTNINNETNQVIVNNVVNNTEEDNKTVYIIKNKEINNPNGLAVLKDEKSIISKENLKEDDVILGKYECTSDNCYECYARQPLSSHLFVGKNKVLLCDGKSSEYMAEWKLYDYENQNIENTFEDVTYSYDISKDDYVIIVKNNGKDALMNKEGNLITDYVYDNLPSNKVGSIGYYSNSTLHYGEKNYVVAGKNNLKGIIDASNGKTVIDFKYEDIMISNNGYYSILDNNKWYLIDQKENKLLSMGYDYIMAFDFGILVFEKEETNKYKVKLIDYNKQDLTNEIKINFIANIHQYYDIKKENDKIIISLNYGIPSDIFKYNITNNTLEFETGVY